MSQKLPPQVNASNSTTSSQGLLTGLSKGAATAGSGDSVLVQREME
jgi:hypothetical protein